MKKLIIFIPIFTVLLLLFIPSFNVLTISNRKAPNDQVITRSGYNDGFVISYTHSVNKGRVHDYYRTINKNELELYETEFVSYGAGIPEPYETPGAVFEVTEDGYFIKNLNRVLPVFAMAVGVIANHTITIGQNITDNSEIAFTDYFPPQTSLIFKVKKISLLKWILSNKLK